MTRLAVCACKINISMLVAAFSFFHLITIPTHLELVTVARKLLSWYPSTLNSILKVIQYNVHVIAMWQPDKEPIIDTSWKNLLQSSAVIMQN